MERMLVLFSSCLSFSSPEFFLLFHFCHLLAGSNSRLFLGYPTSIFEVHLSLVDCVFEVYFHSLLICTQHSRNHISIW